MIIAIVASGIVALKYFLLIRKTPISLPVRTLLKINLISRYYALLLPSAIGVEAVRWLKVTNNRGSKALFTASTFFERFSFLSVLLFAGTIPLFFSVNPEIIILRKKTPSIDNHDVCCNFCGDYLYSLKKTSELFAHFAKT